MDPATGAEVANTFGFGDAIVLIIIAYLVIAVFFKAKKKFPWSKAIQWPLQLKKSADDKSDL